MAEFQTFFAEPLRNGLTRPKAVRGAGVHMVNMGELFAYGRLKNVAMDRVPLSDKERHYLLQPGDLLFARQSLVLEGAGKCSIFLESTEETTFESHLIRARLDRDRADPLFFYYFFQSPTGRAAIASIVEQVAAAGIRSSDLARLDIDVPSIQKQRAIARIIGALDDKAELNQRMNATVEAMMRTLFKAWFVDLDCENLEPLGAFGCIEVGGDWGEECEFVGSVEASCLRGVDLQHLRESGRAVPPRRWFRSASLRRRQMDERDVLVAASGAGPTGRSLWMIPELIRLLGPCTYSNFCKRVRCGSAAEAAYLDSWLNEMRLTGEIWEYVNGTSVPNLDATSLLKNKLVPRPSDRVLSKYAAFSRLAWMKKYSEETTTVIALRDALLPKLISGELPVKDVEKFVEAAA